MRVTKRDMISDLTLASDAIFILNHVAAWFANLNSMSAHEVC